ncbi:MAG: DUF2441 domain-containing protein [Lachnospiraceae bacterium]|nr:DUF2441 domain-containing protein [Lachnospiraceae bacterium]
MKVYHMSQFLKVGDKLKAGYRCNKVRCNEFISALEQSENSLEIMISSVKLNNNEWREYIKWCVEGIFEFVRKTEFSYLPSRLDCSYYFDTLEYFKILYEAGWAQESEEERAKIKLFEIDLEEKSPIKCDMVIFDEAYDIMLATKDIKDVIVCARRYFSGEYSKEPIWEMMSDKSAIVKKDITKKLIECIGI